MRTGRVGRGGGARRPARLVAVLAATLAVVLGCGAPPTPATTPGPPPVPTTTVPPSPPSPSRARAAVDAADGVTRRDGVTLGVAVIDRATGAVETNAAGNQGLRAASVTKLFTVVDLLGRRAAGQVATQPGDEERIRRALGPSDDAAMNALWSSGGGTAGVARVAAQLGLTATAPPGDPSQWGETTTSARDVAVLLGAVADRLAPTDRDLVLSSMAAAPPVGADGFDQAFGLLEPSSRGAALAKQGWLCCLQSSVDLHSVGFPEPGARYGLALMSNQPFGYGPARRVLDEAAVAARAALPRE